MRWLVPIVAAPLILGGCEAPVTEPRVTVERAWVTLPILPGRPGAAYFTLRANYDPTRLTGIVSAQARRIALHEGGTAGGMARMTPIEEVVFPPGGVLTFAPGASHAMLYGIAPGVRPGGTIRLTFSLEPAPPVTVDAAVIALGDPPPA